MGHGSQLVYKSHPVSLNVSSFLHASLIATTSACAVGSLDKVTLFEPSAMITFSFVITHPNGPPSLLALFIESSIAFIMKLFFEFVFIF